MKKAHDRVEAYRPHAATEWTALFDASPQRDSDTPTPQEVDNGLIVGIEDADRIDDKLGDANLLQNEEQ